MALPLILRNCTKSQAIIPNLFRNNNGLSLSSRKAYSGLLSAWGKNAGLNQKSTNFALAKRGMSSDHSKLWPIEKIVTIGLLGVTPVALISPNLFLDDAFAILTVIHFHWGLESSVVDYVRPLLFGSTIPKVALGLLYLLSFASLGGLLYYNHHSIGIGNSCKKLWAIQK